MEEAAIQSIISGDVERFEELVNAYKDKIFSMAYQFTGNMQEGQDLAQEIFILIYKNLKSFNGQSRLSTWIYRVSLNRCLDWQRKKRRQKLLMFTDHYIEQLPSTHDTPEETALKNEETKFLHQAIGQLPQKYQQVIILYHFQNLSYQEIAQILEIPVRTVETRLYRGKQKLKDLMTEIMTKGASAKNYGYIHT